MRLKNTFVRYLNDAWNLLIVRRSFLPTSLLKHCAKHLWFTVKIEETRHRQLPCVTSARARDSASHDIVCYCQSAAARTKKSRKPKTRDPLNRGLSGQIAEVWPNEESRAVHDTFLTMPFLRPDECLHMEWLWAPNICWFWLFARGKSVWYHFLHPTWSRPCNARNIQCTRNYFSLIVNVK